MPYFSEDFGGIGERAARDGGKKYFIPADMKYNDWEGVFVKGGDKSELRVVEDASKEVVTVGADGVIIKAGAISGALNPDSSAAMEHAERYYKAVRKMTADCEHITINTGYAQEQIQTVKDYIFMRKHDFGDGELVYFYPSYAMAESWRRLIDGKNIQLHD